MDAWDYRDLEFRNRMRSILDPYYEERMLEDYASNTNSSKSSDFTSPAPPPPIPDPRWSHITAWIEADSAPYPDWRLPDDDEDGRKHVFRSALNHEQSAMSTADLGKFIALREVGVGADSGGGKKAKRVATTVVARDAEKWRRPPQNTWFGVKKSGRGSYGYAGPAKRAAGKGSAGPPAKRR